MRKPPKNDEAEIMRQYYRAVFSTAQGKKVLEDLKLSLQYGRTLYIPKTKNEDTFFLLGRQSVINDIIGMISVPENKEK